MKIHCSFLY